MDRDYNNIHDLTETQLLAVLNRSGHYVAGASDFSYIYSTGTINADVSYSAVSAANYIAFQNPYYNNKWFFGWIDRIEYKSDANVTISWTLDVWTTWHNDITFLPCFVEREHVNDDTFKANLLPEPVQPSKIIETEAASMEFITYYLVVVYVPNSGMTSSMTFYNIASNYFSACKFVAYPNTQAGIGLLVDDLNDSAEMAGDGSNIVSMFMYPVEFMRSPSGADYDPADRFDMKGGLTDYHILVNNLSNKTFGAYTPKNNKMYMYPYNCISVDDGSTETEYRYEFFNPASVDSAGHYNVSIDISGAVIPTGEIVAYPENYEALAGKNNLYAVTVSNFPQAAFPIDSYKAWLAQKSTPSLISKIGGVLSGAVGGLITGGPAGAAAGAGMGLLNGATSYLSEMSAAENAPNHTVGQDHSSIDTINGLTGFHIKWKRVIEQEAKTIDHFFSMYGYNVSEVKIPNTSGRLYWNYVKAQGSVCYGELPEDAREQINSIFNKGTTIWHDHSYMGNYLVGDSDLDNPITT